MSKRSNKNVARISDYRPESSAELQYLPPPPVRAVRFTPKNSSQEQLSEKIANNDIIFITGPAGTGKTYVSGMLAAAELSSRRIHNIVVTRPVVEADGEDMGFLPGELHEKFAPWFEPFRDVMEQALGSGPLKYYTDPKHGQIVPSPMAYMRGKSYRDTWMIMDEAQNASVGQMKMFLTRIGEGSKIIVLGDIKQSDRPGVSGLEDAVRRLWGIPGVAIHEFTKNDIVRHDIVRKILDRYED
jgi:phosphate starvation-inducible protein PhoH and related proteins